MVSRIHTRAMQVWRIKITFILLLTNYFVSTKSKFDEIPCKLDSTENLRLFAKCLTLPQFSVKAQVGIVPISRQIWHVLVSKEGYLRNTPYRKVDLYWLSFTVYCHFCLVTQTFVVSATFSCCLVYELDWDRLTHQNKSNLPICTRTCKQNRTVISPRTV